ncbi:beta-1,4-galactosyltransferase 4-like [Babylonia areolata]|uniref:beta-1,4-galactosyltransferase 4-like n=1 Tax=Babylonia areolata TaxID=304850 RepID=UPI003FD16ED4
MKTIFHAALWITCGVLLGKNLPHYPRSLTLPTLTHALRQSERPAGSTTTPPSRPLQAICSACSQSVLSTNSLSDVSPATTHSAQLSSASLPECPCVPPNLVGFRLTQEVNKPMEVLEAEFGGVLGKRGSYRPPDCLPKDRTAILVSCTNRWTHLRIFLNHLIPFLIRQQVSFTVWVIESVNVTHFNKGITFNAGVLEALKFENYTCFIFHDVDMLPLNDLNLYRCGPQPVHLAPAVDKFNFKLVYPALFGGAVAMTREQFFNVNGYTNALFGWGLEDDDLYSRVVAKGYTVARLPDNMAQYHMIVHKRDEVNKPTYQTRMLKAHQKTSFKRMDKDGLRQAVYHTVWIKTMPLFLWLRVRVNEEEVIQNLPRDIRSVFGKGVNALP